MGIRETESSKRRKRIGPEVREEALVVARGLLRARGPSAVTLANVGDALGMTHANVLYHFGSASGLQSALMRAMVNDLAMALDRITNTLNAGVVGPLVVIDHVFDAFGSGGAGSLAAWIILSGNVEYLEPLREAMSMLVEAIADREGGAKVEIRARNAVLMMIVAAFGDAVLGPYVRDVLGENDDATRLLVTRSLSLVSIR